MNETNPVIENVPVIDITQDGTGVARIEGLVYFVKGAVPGDVIDLNVYKRTRKLAEANLVNIKTPSPERVTPHCEHFSVCGGCSLQHISYEAQLKFKQKQVEDALTRLGKIQLPPIMQIIPSKQTTFYRNRLEYTFSNKRWLTKEELSDSSISVTGGYCGFHTAGAFYKVIDIVKCYHQPDPSNAIRLWLKQYAIDRGLAFFDIMKQEGLLRNLIIRNTSTGEWMVIIVFHHEDERIPALLADFAEQFLSITSIQYIINPKRNDTIFDLDVVTYKGLDHIYEEMEGLRFKISAKSFYQTNSKQAYELYKVARSFAGLKGNELVYDLYTGTGTIALFIASQCRQVVGVDHTADAIKDAEENARFNNVSNAKFFAGDLKDTMSYAFILEHGMPDVVITDPPRAGMHPVLVKKLLEIVPEKIVYVSCNPATQARDLAMLDEKYSVEKVQPVDMFPHTSHVENVVLLRKRG